MTDKPIVDAVNDAIDDVQVGDFAGAVLGLLPDLWQLWKRHQGDVQAMRRALQAHDDRLAAGRSEVDAALAAKRGA